MFQLETETEAVCTNANPRREFHGKELVRAIDLTFEITGENTLLDVIEQGLRRHHYTNAAADAGQIDLDTVEAANLPLPNLRFAKLPTENIRYGETKTRGYRWLWSWGIEAGHVDFTDVVVHGINYTIQEGGSCTVKFTVTYNGDELSDNELYGELCALASMGKLFIQLLAPPEVIAVKKGYRAGKPDTSSRTDPGQQSLLPDGEQQDGHVGDPGAFVSDEDDDVLEPGSPEAALAGTQKAVVH